VQNPLTSLPDGAAAAKRVIDTQNRSVILVGHSWGGTVITEASGSPKAAALVYVDRVRMAGRLSLPLRSKPILRIRAD